MTLWSLKGFGYARKKKWCRTSNRRKLWVTQNHNIGNSPILVKNFAHLFNVTKLKATCFEFELISIWIIERNKSGVANHKLVTPGFKNCRLETTIKLCWIRDSGVPLASKILTPCDVTHKRVHTLLLSHNLLRLYVTTAYLTTSLTPLPLQHIPRRHSNVNHLIRNFLYYIPCRLRRIHYHFFRRLCSRMNISFLEALALTTLSGNLSLACLKYFTPYDFPWSTRDIKSPPYRL